MESGDANDILLYPNPTTGNFVLSFTNPNKELINIDLLNVLGQSLQSISEDQPATKQFNKEINATNLPQGIYFVRVTIGFKTTTKKLVIER